MEKKKVYFNAMQREVMQMGANTSVIVAGRGTGKGQLHAAVNLRNFQAMPRSTTGFIVPNIKRALTNTLPSMFQHWEAWGFRRGLHWLVGRQPPRSLGWPSPLIMPENWDNVISFYTGAIGQIITQERTGTANSKSFDFLDIDEAKYIKFQALKEEVFPANRGQGNVFGACPWHHGMLITSDLSLTRQGAWFMDWERHHDPALCELITALQAEIATVRSRELTPDDRAQLVNEWRYQERKLRKLLDQARRHCTFFRRYSSLTNLEVLGMDYIAQQKRDLPPLVFRTSILCLPVDILRDGFYSSMTTAHRYTPADSSVDLADYDYQTQKNSALLDTDHDPTAPLCIAFDYNANINWLVVGQSDEAARRLNVIKSFFVKYERKLPELVDDFCAYYAMRSRKEVVYYYDATAKGSNYAVSTEDFHYIVCQRLRSHGWRVRDVYLGRPMNHIEKHLLINRGFAGHARLVPYFNEPNNEYLLISVQTAGLYNGKKDKRGEKLAETDTDRLEARTDGSDAFDTLYIGCEKFPQGAAFSLVDFGGIV